MDIIKPNQKWHRYSTNNGLCLNGDCKEIITKYMLKNYAGKVQLIFTSPPFPLNRKKNYGNLNGDEYIDWLCSIGGLLKSLLSEDGSLVIELGNARRAYRFNTTDRSATGTKKSMRLSFVPRIHLL